MDSLRKAVLKQWREARPAHVRFLEKEGNLEAALESQLETSGQAVRYMRESGMNPVEAQREAVTSLLYLPSEEEVPILPESLAPFGQPPPPQGTTA